MGGDSPDRASVATHGFHSYTSTNPCGHVGWQQGRLETLTHIMHYNVQP